MNKRIYIYAYTQLNLGDDLFIKILCNRYPKTKFYIMCNKNLAAALKTISNLVVISNIPIIDGILRGLHINISVNNILQRCISFCCDAIVNIGGSIFIEDEQWENTIKKFKKRIIRKKPYYIIGSNFGPYKNIEYYEKYKSVFKSITDICFRDTYTYKLFSDLPNVRCAEDIVFSYPSVNITNEKKQIIISVIDLSNRIELQKYEKVYKDKIIELSRYFIEKGYLVFLMGFCENEGDKKAIIQLISRLNHEEKKYITPYYYLGDLDSALKLIQKSQYIIASRFHSMILGWVFHKPVYPVVYSDKSLHVMKDMGFSGKYTSINDINKINANEIFKYLLKSKPLNIEQQIYSANLQFKMLDKFLLKDKFGDRK